MSNTKRKRNSFTVMDAGWGKQNTLFSLVMDGERAFVHINLAAGGYMVFAPVPDEQAELIKHKLADFYEQGKHVFAERAR